MSEFKVFEDNNLNETQLLEHVFLWVETLWEKEKNACH